MREIYSMMLQILAAAPSKKAFAALEKTMLPTGAGGGGSRPTADEYEQATAEFMEEFGIPREVWQREMEQLSAPLRDREAG